MTVTTTVKKGSEVVDTQSVTTGGEGQKKATVAFVNTYNDKPETLGGDGEVKDQCEEDADEQADGRW